MKWLTELSDRTSKFLEILPASIPALKRNKNSLLDPLFRFLAREVGVADKLLDLTRKNLADLRAMGLGEIQPLQELKRLARTVYASEIPKSWKKYVLPTETTTSTFISDFKARLDQFKRFAETSDWQKSGVWLGGIIFPEAFLTATRQAVAQNKGASLDELELKMELWDKGTVGDDSFLLKDLSIEGAVWEGAALQESSKLSSPLAEVKCTWVKSDEVPADDSSIMVPVYLNQSRQNLLFSVKLNRGTMETNFLYKRGIALIAWKSE